MTSKELRAPLALGALALVPCLLYLLAEVGALAPLGGGLGFPLDDSWIHVAFARSLAAGDGLAINPGEPVTGSTAPLWTALVALLALVFRSPESLVLPVKLLGVALHLGGVVLVWALSRELRLSRRLAALAAVLALATDQLVWSALSGMEIPLFVVLSLGGILLHLRERREPERVPASLAVLALGALARPEGVLLLGLAAAERLLVFRHNAAGDDDGAPEPAALERPGRVRWAGLFRALVPAALVLGPVALSYMVIWGSPLPTTFAAKAGAGGSAGLHLPDGRYLVTALGILFRSQPWTVLAAGAGVVGLVARVGTPRDRGLLPALWLLGLPLAYSMITPPGGSPLVGNFGRYLFPLLPVLVVLGALGLEPVARLLGGPRRRPVPVALAVALLLVPTLLALVRGAGFYARNVSDITRGDVTMAKMLARDLPPEATVATMDIGAMATFLPNRIVDLAAIANPEVRRDMAAARAAGGTWWDGVWAFVERHEPDYLMIFPSWIDPRSAPPAVRGGLRPVARIEVPGNITLGGDELVLFATPWTDQPLRNAPGATSSGAAPAPRPDPEGAPP